MTNNKKPSRQEMINAIYEEIADKTLSFGCEIKKKNIYFKILGSEVGGNFFLIGPAFKQYLTTIEDIAKCEIIGHPVMIGDVIDFIYNELPVIISPKKTMNIVNRDGKKINITELLYFWKEKRKPIEEQSDECIDFVYNLISK